MDIMNASLLNTGFSLVRRGRLLKCIDLEQELSKEVIKEFAEFVSSPQELAKRGDFEPVRYLFTLTRLTQSRRRQRLNRCLAFWVRSRACLLLGRWLCDGYCGECSGD